MEKINLGRWSRIIAAFYIFATNLVILFNSTSTFVSIDRLRVLTGIQVILSLYLLIAALLFFKNIRIILQITALILLAFMSFRMAISQIFLDQNELLGRQIDNFFTFIVPVILIVISLKKEGDLNSGLFSYGNSISKGKQRLLLLIYSLWCLLIFSYLFGFLKFQFLNSQWEVLNRSTTGAILFPSSFLLVVLLHFLIIRIKS